MLLHRILRVAVVMILSAIAFSAAAEQPFDGEWEFKLRMRGGNVQCDGVVWRNSTVRDGKLTGELFHAAVGVIPLIGSVSPAGEVKVQGSNGFVVGTGTGTAEGETASGRFDATVDVEHCRGTWTAARLK